MILWINYELATHRQRARAGSIKREFKAYKEKHTLSGDLGALQAAVFDLQAQLKKQAVDEKKE
jgi:hypothetical protein